MQIMKNIIENKELEKIILVSGDVFLQRITFSRGYIILLLSF